MLSNKIKYITFSAITLFSIVIDSSLNGQNKKDSTHCLGGFFLSQNWWFEFEGYNSYRHNDFYISDYHDYGISESIVRTGSRIINLNSVFVVEPYFYGHFLYDVFNKPWNRVDWHNNYIYGIGSRFRVILKSINWINHKFNPREFNFDLFFEKLWVGYQRKTEFYIGHRPQDDLKVGCRYWLELGNKKSHKKKGLTHYLFNYFWIESAGNFYYSKSSFYVKSQQNFYLLNLQNKLGMRIRANTHIFGEPYIKSDWINDFGTKSWNRLDWHNYFRYGIGIRCKYYHQLEYKKGMTNLIIGPYFEFLKTRYGNKVPYIPGYRPASDYWAGIEIWFSINGKKI